MPTTKTSSASPTAAAIKDELIAFWDGFVLLNKKEIEDAYVKGKKLGDLGMLTDDAEACTNKYNSLILRGNGRGPLVSAQRARKFLSEKMCAIVDEIIKRAKP